MRDEAATFGARLRRLREAAALSQEALAARAGLSRRGVSDLERGARQLPRLETVRLLAEALALGETDRAALLAAARPVSISDAAVPPTAALAPPPVPLTRLIGRAPEVAALRTGFAERAVRWVTLTGPGGVGKTRLALAVAADAEACFPAGVHFVDLTPLTDPAQVIPTIAAALGVRETPGQALRSTLAAALAGGPHLLILDNCERVLDAGGALGPLVGTCPGLTLLATSREAFHVPGERAFPVPPLPLPALAQTELSELRMGPAVTLFAERAQAVEPTFALTAENAAAVVAICQRLDGLPLAIELAAARVKTLPVPALLARLDRRLPLLRGGGSALPARQRTMRAAIAWSYDLLSSPEQTALRHLAIFVGGFTLAGAAAVLVQDDVTVVELISALVERSLLRQTAPEGHEPRYRMLETVREFGLEQLEAADDAAAVRRRHAAYFLAFADDAPSGGHFLEDERSVGRVRHELDDVQLAIAWFAEQGEIAAVLRLSVLVIALWFQRGQAREAQAWVERALTAATGVVSASHTQVVLGAGMLALFQGELATASAHFTAALTEAQALENATLIGHTLNYVALVAYRHGDYDQAETVLAEAQGFLQEQGPTLDPHVADAFGDIALAREQFVSAAAYFAGALAVFGQSRYAFSLSDAQAGLAAARYCLGDHAEAAVLYADSLRRAAAEGFAPLVSSALLGLAGIAAGCGEAETGAHLFGVAEALIADLGVTRFPRDRPVQQRSEAALQEALGTDRFAALRNMGCQQTVSEAVAAAEQVVAVMRAKPRSPAW